MKFMFFWCIMHISSSEDMDLSNWMSNLPAVLHEMPLNLLAIPGSHDSFSYTISPKSKFSPDERRLQCFNRCVCFSPVVKKFIYKWTVTQSASCIEQLERGIRYFDFRLASDSDSLTPFIVHGMYGTSAIDILRNISDFLSDHRREIVILDFQHFYNFTDDMHSYLMDRVTSIFDKRICPFGVSSLGLQLSQLWKFRFQVIVVYRDDHAVSSSMFWSGQYVPTPWPNTANPRKMIRTLESNYEKYRNDDYFYVTQGILTPDLWYILTHFYTSLERNIAPKATGALLAWMRNKHAGQDGINIVISDFSDSKLFNFSSTVIGLNYKLADNLEIKDNLVKQ